VERGLTIFVCTPYMDEAERCTRVGLLNRGKLIATGTPAQIKALVHGHVLEFTPTALEAARRVVSGIVGVLEVQTYGDRLHVFVEDVAESRPRIEAALDANGIGHDAGREIPARMEEAYISLLSREMTQPA
jgi:ABC-2 type transport system ATP-binding protein